MGTKLGKMTLGSLFKKPETILYPVQHRFVPEGLKGHIENDMEVCILCGICMKRCPTGAIVVDKPNNIWAINRFRCVQCGSCVRECPQHCLKMEPTYAPVSREKFEETFTKPESSKVDKAAKKTKEPEGDSTDKPSAKEVNTPGEAKAKTSEEVDEPKGMHADKSKVNTPGTKVNTPGESEE